MNEELLHYIWKFQLFNHSDLQLTSGEKLEILTAGQNNTNAGPDFFNGQIKVENTRWAGNVEIHIRSSDWEKHNHQSDKLYDKIILHIVWEDDKPVTYRNGELIPTLELKGRVNKTIFERYTELKSNTLWIPCEKQIHNIDEITKIQCLDRNLIERLKQKSDRIGQLLKVTTNDWEATLYTLLAKYFGFKVNAVPFELLASSINISIVRKYRNDQKQLSALFFGQAGFLNDNLKGNYPQELYQEYHFLKHKHQLVPLNPSIWKFMRMRPANFPTIRIAQFVQLLHKNTSLFEQITTAKKLESIKTAFQVAAETYWDSHFRFDVPASKKEQKSLGDKSIDLLLINVLIPLLFTYGEKMGDEKMKERGLQFLQDIPPEVNRITKKWKELNFSINSAYDSQALIQLKNVNCSSKNCLHCTIGSVILKRDNS